MLSTTHHSPRLLLNLPIVAFEGDDFGVVTIQATSGPIVLIEGDRGFREHVELLETSFRCGPNPRGA